MRNPYEILGINENATEAEIKKAYRELAKKYHPDQYGTNPLKELAEEKMREVNEAYDYLMKNKKTNSSYSSNSYSSAHNYGDNSNIYAQIRMNIANRRFAEAESQLNSLGSRDAEWNYLYGVVMLQKGWYDSAVSYLETACSLDPNNFEYRQTLNSIRNQNRSYGSPYRQTSNNADFCNLCINLWCLDSMCECCGGDLIPCI
ncbi:J domain-containing protein [Inconstantimicrobium mannanitabidum]|uniref:Molecular chaperone DnaJ n=1 Tax=Inconstantimicrobium mannanitabidum TaxID=1604901 RepID=A0ACB5RCE0_9CLOT|nr:DnaJ domain-containing protein [Clostridium sp. TW13]GKX66908.1 molecular chaperone DnaJ [Clostridium sp. TW13]